MRARANLLLLVTAAIWGFAFVAQRVGAQHVGAFTFNGVRFALGAASLLPLVLSGRRLAARGGPDAGSDTAAPGWVQTARAGALCGLVLFAGATFQQAGLSTTTAGKAGFVTGLYIVLVPLLGMALGHRTTVLTWAGVVFAAVGLYLLTVTESLTMAAGDALVLAGAFCWATHILVINHVVERHDPLRIAMVSLVTAVATDPAPFAGVSAALVPILYGGLLSVGVAYTLQVVAQRHAHPSTAALIMSTEAVFGALGGWLLLGEDLGARGYAGAALMMGGIVLSQLGEDESATPQARDVSAASSA
jgi:drug/metabolite transporter (DMT)-like permease